MKNRNVACIVASVVLWLCSSTATMAGFVGMEYRWDRYIPGLGGGWILEYKWDGYIDETGMDPEEYCNKTTCEMGATLMTDSGSTYLSLYIPRGSWEGFVNDVDKKLSGFVFKHQAISGAKPGSKICLTIDARWRRTGNPIIMGNSCDGTLPPIPPPDPDPVSCTDTGEVRLQHGTLEYEQSKGSVAQGTYGVTCDGDATVRVTATAIGGQSDIVVLDAKSGLSTELKVNGKAGDTGDLFAVKKGIPKEVLITSTLNETHDHVGAFSGSGSLIINIQ